MFESSTYNGTCNGTKLINNCVSFYKNEYYNRQAKTLSYSVIITRIFVLNITRTYSTSTVIFFPSVRIYTMLLSKGCFSLLR